MGKNEKSKIAQPRVWSCRNPTAGRGAAAPRNAPKLQYCRPHNGEEKRTRIELRISRVWTRVRSDRTMRMEALGGSWSLQGTHRVCTQHSRFGALPCAEDPPRQRERARPRPKSTRHERENLRVCGTARTQSQSACVALAGHGCLDIGQCDATRRPGTRVQLHM